MSDLSFESLVETVRQKNGYYSVLDLIRVCSSYKSGGERKAWKRLTENYNDLSPKCHGIAFEDNKGRTKLKTPCMNKEDGIQLIGLLPGEIGNKYRSDAAKLMITYLENPEKLIDIGAQRLVDKGEGGKLHKSAARLKGMAVRSDLVETADKHIDEQYQQDKGKIIGSMTNGTYKGLYGKKANELREQHSIPAKQPLRDAMSDDGLALVMFSEMVTKKKIEQDNVRNWELPNASEKMADKVKRMYKDILNN